MPVLYVTVLAVVVTVACWYRNVRVRSARMDAVRRPIPSHGAIDVTRINASIRMTRPVRTGPRSGVVILAGSWVGFEMCDGTTYVLERTEQVVVTHSRFGPFAPWVRTAWGKRRPRSETTFEAASMAMVVDADEFAGGHLLSPAGQDAAREVLVDALALHRWPAAGPVSAEVAPVASESFRLQR